jgi:hypothetical protein
MVTDGSLRDIKGICDVGFPVFAKPWTVPNGSLEIGSPCWSSGRKPGAENVRAMQYELF